MVSFTRQLVQRFPQLNPILEEHMRDNFGEILPTVFFGDLARWIEATYAKDDASQNGDGTTLGPLFAFLEESFAAGDTEVQELISVGLLENLPGPDEPGSAIRELLGPHLREEVERVN
jgi:hypothetical protein